MLISIIKATNIFLSESMFYLSSIQSRLLSIAIVLPCNSLNIAFGQHLVDLSVALRRLAEDVRF